VAAGVQRVIGRYLEARAGRWTPERLAAHQQRRVGHLLRFLRRRSPYYRSRLPAGALTLDDAPPMDKAEMMRAFDLLNTAGLHRDELVAFRIEQERAGHTELFRGRYSVGLSSGTSGNKVLTVLSPSERARYAALLWARSGVPRDLARPRVLFALRTNNPAFTAVTTLGVELVYVDYFVPLEELVAQVNDRRLNVLAGPPSLLSRLADERDRIQVPIAAVLSYAEELDDPTRARLARVFGAPVAEIYQGAEGMLAFTCPAGTLHLNEDVTLVELEEAGDHVGDARRAVVTDLYRRTQPFVRYQLNDLIELAPGRCACGSAFRRIRRVHGRADSILWLRGRDGGRVMLMPDYVRRAINQASPDVHEYQAVQWAPDDLEIRLRLAPGAARPPVEEAIGRNLTHWVARAGGVVPALRFTTTPPVPDPTSHKLVRVLNRCPR
jgi:putative adenylate-forming enzyme